MHRQAGSPLRIASISAPHAKKSARQRRPHPCVCAGLELWPQAAAQLVSGSGAMVPQQDPSI
jgi:hypothetical protein